MQRNNIYFSVEEMNRLIEDIDTCYSQYETPKDNILSWFTRYETNDTYKGEDATASKNYIKVVERGLVESHTQMQYKLKFLYRHMLESFSEKVDSAPDARVDTITLETVQSELRDIQSVEEDYCGYFDNTYEYLQNNYGHIVTFTKPRTNAARESMALMCGDIDNPKSGSIYEFKQSVINFDEEECEYAKSALFMDDGADFRNKVAQSNLMLGNVAAADPVVGMYVVKKITNLFNKKTEDIIQQNASKAESTEKKKIVKKLITEEEKLAYVQKYYGFSVDDMEYLKAKHREKLLALFGVSMYSSYDAGIIHRQIDLMLDPTNGFNEKAKKSYVRNKEIIQNMQTAYNGRFNDDLASVKRIYKDNKQIYLSISEKTGVPAELICAIHYRESACNFKTHLHNGQPLGKPTTIVPKSVCFDNFEDAAVDALTNNIQRTGISFEGRVDDATCLAYAEAFNGYGYMNNGYISPYLFSGTSAYEAGKYVSDHNYDPNYIDKQVGVYCLFHALEE